MEPMTRSFLLVLIMAAVTALLRFLPFVLFSRRTPRLVTYLGRVLPYSIIAMLVVYCLRGTDFAAAEHGLGELISIALVVALHKWKHNTLLSILAGTVCYMLFVQIIFI